MTDNTAITAASNFSGDEIAEGQMDLFTGEVVETETETEEITVDTVVAELVKVLEEDITAYKVAVVINSTFKIMGITKQIPTQMMYNYTRNGLVAKGKKGKASDIRYTKDEVTTFVTKYVNKYM